MSGHVVFQRTFGYCQRFYKGTAPSRDDFTFAAPEYVGLFSQSFHDFWKSGFGSFTSLNAKNKPYG